MGNPISLLRNGIVVRGKVFDSDSRKRMDLKKPIRDMICWENPVEFVMEHYPEIQQLMERMKELSEEGYSVFLMRFEEVEP